MRYFLLFLIALHAPIGLAGNPCYLSSLTTACFKPIGKTSGGTGISSTATFPSSGVVVTEAGSEILTNKTLSGNIATNLINSTGQVNFPSTGTITIPAATDTLVGRATTDALTNKDYQGGTASNTSRLTVPNASYSTIVGLTRKQGTLLFDTDSGRLVSDDGSNLNAVAVPEKNYLANGSSSASGWGASSASITVATDTVAADLPRGITTKSGIVFTGVSGATAYGFYNFTLDPADYNKKLKVQFDMVCGLSGASSPIASCAANNFLVQVKSCTVAWSGSPATTCSGTKATLNLSTDVSGASALPALTGTYRTTFDSPGLAAQYLQLQIGLNASTTNAIAVSDVVVGPGVVTQGAAVTQWTSFTPTVNVSGTGTGTSASVAYWRRVGETMEVQGYFTPNATSTVTVTASLPSGYTINTSALSGAGSTSSDILGHGFYDNSTNELSVVYGTSTSVSYLGQGNANRYGATTTIASAHNIVYHYTVPINEWAGAGTVNVVQNDVEYASNDGSGGTAANTNYTTGTVYGPAGSLITSVAISGTTASTATSYEVQWQTPLQSTDMVFLELQEPSGTGNGSWHPLMGGNVGGIAWLEQNINIGVRMAPHASDATRTVVYFSNAGRDSSATYGTASGTWASVNTWRWRLRKTKGGQAIGFGNVTQTAAGLVQSAGQLLGTNTNDTANAGNVGEFISATAGSTVAPGSTTAYKTLASISLTAGDWDVSGAIAFTGGVTPPSNMTYIAGAISKNNNATDASNAGGYIDVFVSTTNLNSADFYTPVGTRRISLSATTTIYLTGAINYTAVNTGLWKSDCFIQARRVR